jgi:hypothetical protein
VLLSSRQAGSRHCEYATWPLTSSSHPSRSPHVCSCIKTLRRHSWHTVLHCHRHHPAKVSLLQYKTARWAHDASSLRLILESFWIVSFSQRLSPCVACVHVIFWACVWFPACSAQADLQSGVCPTSSWTSMSKVYIWTFLLCPPH